MQKRRRIRAEDVFEDEDEAEELQNIPIPEDIPDNADSATEDDAETEAESEIEEEGDFEEPEQDASPIAVPARDARRGRQSKRRRLVVQEEEESTEDGMDPGGPDDSAGTAGLDDDAGGEDGEKGSQERSTKLTKRQQAVLQRQSGQAGEQWGDAELPEGLSYGWKGKGPAAGVAPESMSEEQQLKRLEAINRRRAYEAKRRKEAEESVKARIRAGTSAKFKAEAGRKAAKDAAAEARRNLALQPGMIRVKMQAQQTTLFWPPDVDPALAWPSQRHQGYPPPKHEVPLLGIQRAAAGLRPGCQLLAVATRNDKCRLLCMNDAGDTFGFLRLEPAHAPAAGAGLKAVVRSVSRCRGQPEEVEAVVLRLELPGPRAA